MDTEELLIDQLSGMGCDIGYDKNLDGLLMYVVHWNTDVAELVLQLKNIRGINLYRLYQYDLENDAIDDLGKLNEIRHFGANFGKEIKLEFVKNWKKLEEIELTTNPKLIRIGKRVPFPSQYFKNCNEIKRISLTGMDLSSENYDWITSRQQLNKLSLWSNELNDEIEQLADCKSLINLEFKKSKLHCPPLSLSFICDSKISFLDISFTNIDDRHLEILENSKSLQSLIINQTKVTDRGLRHLTNLPELLKLKINSHIVTMEGIESLSNCNKLKELWVYEDEENLLDKKIVKHLRDSLPGCKIEIY